MLRVELLGEFAVARDGVPLTLPHGLARLTAFLALRLGPRQRDQVAGTFWSESPEEAARSSLRTAVWGLRKALGSDAVIATRTAVGFAPDVVRVDVADVETLVAAGDLAGAVALCRGELLPDVAADWADSARRAHHRRHADLLDRLAEAADSRGDGAGAVRWSRIRCELDPLDEVAHVRLLHRLAATGDRSAGLVAGREFARRLRDELGLHPGPALRAAVAELNAAPGVRPPSAVRAFPMFGRSAELAAVTGAWDAARAGHGRIVVVTGEGGIGKTRLVGEVARRASRVGGRVAIGAGLDVGGEAPLAVWHELAAELVAVVPAPPPDAGWPAELGRLAPDLTAGLGRSTVPPPVASPELERLRIFDAVLRLVEWAAAHRPVFLVAEDVHRADRASIALCAHIGRRLARLPVLFLLTRRGRPESPDVDALLADAAGRGTDVLELALGPLPEPDLAAVIRSVVGLPAPDVARVLANADGNPLLAVERARAVAGGHAEPPPSLRVAVRASMGALPRNARELVEALAVAGRGLIPREVAALGLADVAGTEAVALDTDLVQRDRAGLRFRHALLAEAARADLPDPHRRHVQVANAIVAAAGADADRVAAEAARHLTLAGRDDLAGDLWRRAARHARSLGALPEAAGFWLEAVRQAPQDPVPRLELAEVYAWLGRRDDFEREWQDALPYIRADDLALAWHRRGNVMRSVLCHPSEGTAAYQRALDVLPADAPGHLRASVLAGLAQLWSVTGDPDGTEALLTEAERLATDPTPDLVVDLTTARLLLLIRRSRFAELEAAASRGAAAMAAAARPDQAFAGLVTASCGLAAGGAPDAALRLADRALVLTAGVAVLTLPCLAARAHLLARLGRHDEALAAAREQLALAERLDSRRFVAQAQGDAGLVALAAGRPAEAADLLAAALDGPVPDGDAPISRPSTRLARAEALADAGRADDATAELRRAVLEPVGTGDQAWSLVPRMSRIQGRIALARGDRATARRRFTEAIATWRRLTPPTPGDDLMAALVDLGRPPVIGLVEPARELERLHGELAAVQEASCPASP